MSAYIIAEVSVEDAEKYARYRPMVPPSLELFGGRFVVRGGEAELLEGGPEPARLVILEFASAERAKAWWNSDEYADAKALRQAAATTRMVVVEGA